MKRKGIYKFNYESLEAIIRKIYEFPERYENWKWVISSGGGITIMPYSNMLYVDKAIFTRGAKDLGWLARVKKYTRKLEQIPREEFTRLGFCVSETFPITPKKLFRNLQKLYNKEVIYFDITQAYWHALNLFYDIFFDGKILVEIEGVSKPVRNMAWGSLGTRKTIYRVKNGKIEREIKIHKRAPIFYAVPWLVYDLINYKREEFPIRFFWVDCLIGEPQTARVVIENLNRHGFSVREIRGILKLSLKRLYAVADVIHPLTGEVLVSQLWPAGLVYHEEEQHKYAFQGGFT